MLRARTPVTYQYITEFVMGSEFAYGMVQCFSVPRGKEVRTVAEYFRVHGYFCRNYGNSFCCGLERGEIESLRKTRAHVCGRVLIEPL